MNPIDAIKHVFETPAHEIAYLRAKLADALRIIADVKALIPGAQSLMADVKKFENEK